MSWQDSWLEQEGWIDKATILRTLQENYSYGFGGNAHQTLWAMLDWAPLWSARLSIATRPALAERLSVLLAYTHQPELHERLMDMACA